LLSESGPISDKIGYLSVAWLISEGLVGSEMVAEFEWAGSGMAAEFDSTHQYADSN
jgi:hypothetical protein